MQSKFILALLVVILVGCGGGNNKDYVDEKHRPKDWEANLHLVVSADTVEDEFERLTIIDKSSSSNYQDLVDQLFDLAFSEEPSIYLPNALSQMSDDAVDAKELHDFLQAFDTAYIEDLITGEQRDTIIDMSFRKQNVSYLEVVCDFGRSDGKIILSPKMIAIGEQVFNEFGEYRGFRPKFFLGLNESETDNFDDQIALVFQTDSLGLFRANMFSFYHETIKTPFQEMIGADAKNDVEISTNFGFSFRESRLIIGPIDPKLIVKTSNGV
jgi:hypothetical protein